MVNLASFKTQRFQDSGKPIDLGKEEMMVDFDLYMVNFYHSKQTENHFIDVIKMQRNWPKNIYKDRISIMLQRKSLKTKTIFIIGDFNSTIFIITGDFNIKHENCNSPGLM